MSYILYFLNLKINCINNHTPPRRKTSTDITVSISSAPSASKTAAVFILEDCVQKLRISRASVQLDGVLSLSLSCHVKSPSIFFWRKCTIKKSWKKKLKIIFIISLNVKFYIYYIVSGFCSVWNTPFGTSPILWQTGISVASKVHSSLQRQTCTYAWLYTGLQTLKMGKIKGTIKKIKCSMCILIIKDTILYILLMIWAFYFYFIGGPVVEMQGDEMTR